MEETRRPWSEETRLAHDSSHANAAVSPPIYQTSLFTFANYEALVRRYRGETRQPVYSRIDNPTVSEFEDKIAMLEGAQAAAAFASGIAAISNAILSNVQAGERIVCVKHVYPDTYRLLRGVCAKFGITTEFADGTDTDAVRRKLPGAKLLYLESPSSWVMQEQDLASIAAFARAENVITIADNSWASPIFQKPLECGIDLVVHSATKYLSGHSDTIAGVVAGSEVHVQRINREVRPYLGASLSAHDAALLIRGLRTLPLRMQRHQQSALQLAQRLTAHPAVSRVHHPGLGRRASSALRGYGGLFSMEIEDNIDIPTFCDALGIFRLGVSWGGYESLVLPAAVAIDQDATHNPAIDFAISPRLVRLFVGLENPEDLWHDLACALDAGQQG